MPVVRGPVLRVGADMNTDVIIPARFMQAWETLGDHAFEGESPEMAKRAKASKFVVAGKNFGCGSSREQAVMAIKQAGVACVIAPTFARIFYRNAINLALPLLEADVDVPDGADLAVDVATGRIEEPATGRVWQARPISAEAKAIIDDGGLIEHLKRKFGDAPRGGAPP